MKRETKDVWVSDDGLTFATAAECEAHEKSVLERKAALARLKVWSVSHSFDSTEGRGYFGRTLVVSDASQAAIIQWCLDRFGPPLSGWYGDGFYEEWHLNAPADGRDVEWAMKQDGTVTSYGHGKIKVAVVSQKDWTWAGLPPSQFPWPRPARAKGE